MRNAAATIGSRHDRGADGRYRGIRYRRSDTLGKGLRKMMINAGKLRRGMHLAFDGVYVRIEDVVSDTHGMLTAFVRDMTGRRAPVRFHCDELLTVGA